MYVYILISSIIIIPSIFAAVLKYRQRKSRCNSKWSIDKEYGMIKLHPLNQYAHWRIFINMLLIVLGIPAFAGITQSQPKSAEEWQEVRDRFYITMLRLESSEKVVKIQEEQIENLQKRLGVKDTVINLQSLQLKARDEQIELFKQREARVELVPAIRWDGFHLGLSAQYNFEDEILTKETVLAGMRYDVTMAAKVVLFAKVSGTLMAGIPLRKDKFYLKMSAEYRIF